MRPILKDHEFIFVYDHQLRNVKERNIINADYIMDETVLTHSYNVSLTLIIEALYKMGYEKVILYGVELTNSKYFWTDNLEIDPVYVRTNKGNKPDCFHTTYFIKDYIIDFNERFMKPLKREIVVGTKDTLLFPELKYENLKGE